MKARAVAVLLIIGAVASCAPAEVERVKRILWPHDYQVEQPARVELEPEPVTPIVPPVEPEPLVVEPHADPPKVTVEAPKPIVDPVVPMPRPVVRPKPERAKTPITASRRMQPRQKADEGPDLPWPCWLVRERAGGKSDAELRKMGRENNVKLSRKQERQALECLGRK